MPEPPKRPELLLILGAARSGTTLLRSFLDAHPDIGCPAEAGLPALIGHARRVWFTVCASDDPTPADPLRLSEGESPSKADVAILTTHAENEIRRAALAIMEQYCSRGDKRFYCDKSLDSAQHLHAVYRSFPNTKCIILVRHVMDTIASGLEASPFGFDAFGYAPFVHASPENTVMALARYWEMQLSLALKWQTSHPESCHLLRYEDLVADPSATLSGVFQFLGIESDPRVVTEAFSKFRATSGPGDYKLGFTSAVHTESVGRGKRVPVSLIPPALLDRLSELLQHLSYSPLTPSWNAAPNPANAASHDTRVALQRLMSSMHEGEWGFDIDSVAILADDDVDLRWVVEPRSGTVRPGDGDVDLIITGAAADLALMIRGSEHVGVLMRCGRIRRVIADADAEAHLDVPRLMTSLIARFREDESRPNPRGPTPR